MGDHAVTGDIGFAQFRSEEDTETIPLAIEAGIETGFAQFRSEEDTETFSC